MLKAELKICDFGISIKAEEAFTAIGTLEYTDPIILKKMNERNDLKYSKGYDRRADIWSLGVICYEMLTGNKVFNGRNQKEIFNKVEIGNITLPPYLSMEVISFLSEMLQYDYKKRKYIEELSKHEFLNKNVKDFKIDPKLFGDKVGPNGINMNIKQNQSLINILNDYDFQISIINRLLNLSDTFGEINEVPSFTKNSQFNKFNLKQNIQSNNNNYNNNKIKIY